MSCSDYPILGVGLARARICICSTYVVSRAVTEPQAHKHEFLGQESFLGIRALG